MFTLNLPDAWGDHPFFSWPCRPGQTIKINLPGGKSRRSRDEKTAEVRLEGWIEYKQKVKQLSNQTKKLVV